MVQKKPPVTQTLEHAKHDSKHTVQECNCMLKQNGIPSKIPAGWLPIHTSDNQYKLISRQFRIMIQKP